MSLRRQAAVAVPFALVALLATFAIASAHVHVNSISPADGSTVAAPSQVVIALDDMVSDVPGSFSIVVKNAGGATVSTGGASLDGTKMILSVGLPANLPNGVYTVDYAYQSAEDGHASTGSSQFTVGAVPSATASSTPTSSPTGTTTPVPTSSVTTTPTVAPSRSATPPTTAAPRPPQTGSGAAADGASFAAWELGLIGAILVISGAAVIAATATHRN